MDGIKIAEESAMNSRLWTLGFVLAMSVSGGCGGSGGTSTKLTGAGASFPAPLYNRWFQDYHKLHPNMDIDYQSVGSGAGV
jgi:ABC-type phosphate transport system substrate-binding protein